MPLPYAVLKGRPVGDRLATSRNKHYQELVSADGEQHRIAINVKSGDGSQVESLVEAPSEHPITDALTSLEQGLHRLPSAPGGTAIDFIRGNQKQRMPLSGVIEMGHGVSYIKEQAEQPGRTIPCRS